MTQDILQRLHLQPNPMQTETFQAFDSGKGDIVVLSPTGSGKTLAYLVPLAERVDTTQPTLQAVVIVPGRELAEQSQQVLASLGTGIRAMALHGGRPTMDEHRALRKIQPQMVFATPGRLNDHIDKLNIELSHVGYVVIDEFDKCLEMGFDHEMSRIISRMPSQARRVLLSATDTDEIPHYLGDIKKACVVNFLTDEDDLNHRIKLFSVSSPDRDKLATLRQLLLTLGQGSTVVFLNHRDSVERTAQWLRQQGFTVSLYHGGLEQKERERALYKFANGSAPVLVATDLASRGLDVPEIENVVNYHLPETEANYKHRSGRTARWDRSGRTFFILGPGETLPDYISEPVADITPEPSPNATPAAPRMATLYFGKGKKDKISKADIVGFLCKKCGLVSADIGRISLFDHYAYAAVSHSKAQQTINMAKGQKIKGVKTIVEEII